MFHGVPMDFAAALQWLEERTGHRAVVLVTGPQDADAVLVRVDGPLGALEVVDDGQADSEESLATASFRVGDALVSMHGGEFVSAQHVEQLGWILVQLKNSRIEWRVPLVE